MDRHDSLVESPKRRSFLGSLNAGFASLAALAVGSAAVARGQSAPAAKFEPARHDKDDWLDKVPGRHRLVFDTTSADGLGDALLFASNFTLANKTDYGLEPKDLAIVLVVRHSSTVFAYNDAMWAKYGVQLAARAKVTDPKTKEAPKVNYYNAAGYGGQLANRGVTLESLLKQGVALGVCAMATRNIGVLIAQATGGKADEINDELVANILPGARMVPAGIVAVNRAQERGYSLVTT